METKSPKDWKQLLEQFRASGQNARRFASDRQINYHSLAYHIRKERGANTTPKKTESRIIPLTFLAPTDDKQPAEITIQIGKVTLRIGVEG